jgi:arylsulfatase B
MKRGFQSYTGYLQAQGDYYKHNFAIDQLSALAGYAVDGLDFWHNTRPMYEARGNYSLDLYRDALTKVLRGYATKQNTPERRADHPLFIYLAHQTVHIPLQFRRDEPRCASISHKTRRIYCNMLVELDDAIGEMVDEYKSLGLWDNLLILTMTDNGGMVNFEPNKDAGNAPIFPASQGSNYPLRGSKTTMLDGGVKGLAFASGGYIPKEGRGRRISALAHVVDFSATILSAAHVIPTKKEKLKLDGNSLVGLLINRPGAVAAREHVPINVVLGGRRYSAVRFGPYKLIVDDFFNPPAQGWYDKNGDLAQASTPYIKGSIQLYHLEKDPQERTDISKDNEDIVRYGKDLIAMYAEGGDYMEPQESTRFYAKALPILHGGVWMPFMEPSAWQENFEKERSHKRRWSSDDSSKRLRLSDDDGFVHIPSELVEA